MNNRLHYLAVMLIPLLLPGLLEARDEKKKKGTAKAAKAIVLFDGTSLDAWDCHLVDPDLKLEDVWSIQDGVLVCKGEPLGYLHTKQDFKNFRLTFRWRWAPGTQPGNSGVLLRVTGQPVGFMPKCVEAQLMSGSAGDIWAFIGYQIARQEERWKEVKGHEALGDFVGVGAMTNVEKDPGQWNKYSIVMKGDRLTLKINGKKINQVQGCDEVAGKIGLQSEGGEIHFRDVKIVPLD